MGCDQSILLLEINAVQAVPGGSPMYTLTRVMSLIAILTNTAGD